MFMLDLENKLSLSGYQQWQEKLEALIISIN